MILYLKSTEDQHKKVLSGVTEYGIIYTTWIRESVNNVLREIKALIKIHVENNRKVKSRYS